MIYLFYGSDVEKVRTKAFEWVAKAREKEPNLVYARLAREELTTAVLEEAALSGGLFVRRLLVLIDDPFQKTEEETENILETRLDILTASDNAIVILAPRLAAAQIKKLTAKAKVTYRYDAPLASEEKRGFNAALVNALAAKSRERLWLEVNRALRAGDAPEQFHGLLHWKARDMLERNSRVWKPREARELSLSLIALLQDSRRKGLDLAESLERFALSV